MDDNPISLSPHEARVEARKQSRAARSHTLKRTYAMFGGISLPQGSLGLTSDQVLLHTMGAGARRISIRPGSLREQLYWEGKLSASFWRNIFASRHNPETQFLNLDGVLRVLDDSLCICKLDLYGLQLVLEAILSFASTLTPSIRRVSLAKNNIDGVWVFEKLAHHLPGIIYLCLQDNELTLGRLAEVKTSYVNLKNLSELELDGNPCMGDSELGTLGFWPCWNEAQRLFPSLKTLNREETLDPRATDLDSIVNLLGGLAVEETAGPGEPEEAQDAQAPGAIVREGTTDSCSNNLNEEISAVEDKGELTVSAVIESDIQVAEAPTAEEKLAGDVVQYLDGYLSTFDNNRLALSDKYHPDASLTVSIQKGVAKRHSSGLDDVLSTINKLPRTVHDPSLAKQTISFAIINQVNLKVKVQGQFFQLPWGSVHNFVRTFVLAPAKEEGPTVIKPALILTDELAVDESFQPDDWVPGALLEFAKLPSPKDKDQMSWPAQELAGRLIHFMTSTGTNMDYAEDLLDQNDWSLYGALTKFEMLKSKNEIPEEAYLPEDGS